MACDGYMKNKTRVDKWTYPLIHPDKTNKAVLQI